MYTHSDAAILKHLQAGNTLTPASAMSLFGVAAMHSAAARLREQGYVITCTIRSERGRRFGEYRLTNAAQPSRPNIRVTEESPSRAVAAEVIHLNGQRYEVVFDGVSAYDGTRYCSVREK